MKQFNLIQIKRIPMDVEINVTPWRFEPIKPVGGKNDNNTAAVNGAAKPLPIINDFQTHDKLDIASTPTAFTYSQKPILKASAYDDDTSYLEGDLVSKISNNPIRAHMAARPIESVSEKITPPVLKTGGVINWSNGSESYSFGESGGEYTAIPTPTEWKFVPRSVEVVINQLPGVEIEYIGSPLYFPRSADPNYVPPPEI
jgi:hypothetical protein